MKRILSLVVLLSSMYSIVIAADRSIRFTSPDGRVGVEVTIGTQLRYAVTIDGTQVLAPSAMAMTLTDGTVWGQKCRLKRSQVRQVSQTIQSPFTRQASMSDVCTELLMRFAGYDVQVRAYDNGVAYRFVSARRGRYQVKSETVEYVFTADQTVTNPYVKSYKPGQTTIQRQFYNSFENTYTTQPVSAMDRQHLSFLPLVVDLGQGRRMCITESHLESYPGLYLVAADGNRLTGINPPRPKTWHQGGHNMLQLEVDEVCDYIAEVDGPRPFPWRIAMLSRQDGEMAENNLSYLLGAPSRIADTSWIKPGKVAWDWWNDWNIRNVSFRAGINNDTYKYYIDFAAENGIEYVILDEGWAVNLKADLMQVIPEIDLPMLARYAGEKGVGLILWAGYYAFDRDMENVVRHYAAMGIKGFKVDFMNRDDQIMADFYYRTAETCARYKMLVDFHGAFKPAGLNRTWPNVINFEGVHGLEQMKWAQPTVDQMAYDNYIPYIRQAAGPMDYTQGAMLNANRKNYHPCYSEPMSQGTRCHQLALYVTLESPLNMLCDSPSNYLDNPECTRVIACMPTVWDETHVLCGEMGRYIVTARRKGDTWYIGGTTDWDARDVEFSLPAAISTGLKADLYRDGINADRKATDYRHDIVSTARSMKVHMAPGGGFVMIVCQK